MVITLYYMEDACHETTATIKVENYNGLWLVKNWGNMHFLFPDINSLLLVFRPSLIMAIIKLRLSSARKHFKRKKKNTFHDAWVGTQNRLFQEKK